MVLLDIEMPVLRGIDAAPLIKKVSPETKIIFCTAYDEYALKAFDLSASDYLLKPVSKQRLLQALKKVSFDEMDISYTFQLGKDLATLSIKDIYCFVSEEKNTIMYCQLGMIIIDDSLINLESKFAKFLLRINRNALINTDELCGIHRESSIAYVKLKSTDYQPQISRRNITKIKKYLT